MISQNSKPIYRWYVIQRLRRVGTDSNTPLLCKSNSKISYLATNSIAYVCFFSFSKSIYKWLLLREYQCIYSQTGRIHIHTYLLHTLGMRFLTLFLLTVVFFQFSTQHTFLRKDCEHAKFAVLKTKLVLNHLSAKEKLFCFQLIFFQGIYFRSRQNDLIPINPVFPKKVVLHYRPSSQAEFSPIGKFLKLFLRAWN